MLHFNELWVLRSDCQRQVYEPSAAATFAQVKMKGLHYGQRKLHLSEMQLLNTVYKDIKPSKPILFVYAGAAPGVHLPFLFELYPSIKCVLIDPAPFCAEVKALAADGPILELINDICTDELCLRLSRSYGSKHYMVFVSDIRTGNPSKMTKNIEHTKMMEMDNELQKSWCLSIKADIAMLKFHPPYPKETDPTSSRFDPEDDTPAQISYLAGVSLWGVWAPKSSSEVRLVVTGPFGGNMKIAEAVYDCKEHEEICHFYNINNRYNQDCKVERSILEDYISLYPDKYASVVLLSNEMSKRLGFPLFQPLEKDFTEDHARFLSLIYSTRNPEAVLLFDMFKSVMSIDQVVAVVNQYKESEVVPQNVTVGGVKLSESFWKCFCKGDFADIYSLPKFRWRFFGNLFFPKGGVKDNHHAKRRR
ncbi:hypothetical protein STCU_00844 [Strigomonas culicis]|uniref:Cap-specific mRNA (nucleoside-2'-O-)-methyltransferase n=2 Tax=Strigomonas culicis TaxID=28005 RepID=S9UYJ0_9TRYP|nr:hypothetical protein STCU_00844 [Strigomonas culicis]|eukprot:EPY35922.1 hypothetical protein STCU_00844 [Strigomonas culicis]